MFGCFVTQFCNKKNEKNPVSNLNQKKYLFMIDLIWKYSTIQKMYTSKYLFFSEDELTGVEILIATCNGFLSTTKNKTKTKEKSDYS